MIPRRHSTVVELLGVPASGKSSLATALAGLPGVTVVKEHHRRDLPALALSVARSWPVLLAPIPADVSRSRWVAWAGRLGASPEVVRRHLSGGATTIVLDQGPAYSLGRMVGVRRTARGNAWWCERSTECAALLDLLVVLDADPATLTERLHSRDKKHLASSFDDEHAREYLLTEQATCRLVADALVDAGAAVMYLDTSRMSFSAQVSTVTAVLTESAGRREGRR